MELVSCIKSSSISGIFISVIEVFSSFCDDVFTTERFMFAVVGLIGSVTGTSNTFFSILETVTFSTSFFGFFIFCSTLSSFTTTSESEIPTGIVEEKPPKKFLFTSFFSSISFSSSNKKLFALLRSLSRSNSLSRSSLFSCRITRRSST